MTEEEFQRCFKQIIEYGHEGRINQVMTKFGVDRSTVDKWADGTAVPLCLVREEIHKYLMNIYAW